MMIRHGHYASPLILQVKTKRDYRRAFQIVRAHVTDWDPYDLIGGGAPRFEFDQEVELIVKEIPRIRSADDLTAVVSAVFCDAFGENTFPPSECRAMAAKLFVEIERERLLDPEKPGKRDPGEV
jgi:hypothetical protein